MIKIRRRQKGIHMGWQGNETDPSPTVWSLATICALSLSLFFEFQPFLEYII